jgi:hypothetical protein
VPSRYFSLSKFEVFTEVGKQQDGHFFFFLLVYPRYKLPHTASSRPFPVSNVIYCTGPRLLRQSAHWQGLQQGKFLQLVRKLHHGEWDGLRKSLASGSPTRDLDLSKRNSTTNRRLRNPCEASYVAFAPSREKQVRVSSKCAFSAYLLAYSTLNSPTNIRFILSIDIPLKPAH